MTQLTTPREDLLSFKRNTLWHAAFWLVHGEVHPGAHWLIRERLAPWQAAVTQAGLVAELAELVKEMGVLIPPPAPPKQTAWVMPSGRCTGLGDEPSGEPVMTLPSPAEAQECCDSVGAVTDEDRPVTDVSVPLSAATTQFCHVCLKPFEAKRTEAKFCSPACRQQASRQQRRAREVA